MRNRLRNCRMVFHFPSHDAGAPLQLPARHPEISNSRASRSQTAQICSCPEAASQINGALIINLSARGSRRAPQLLPPSALRAIQPSAQSVKAPNRSKSHAEANCPDDSRRRSGAPSNARIRVNRSAQRRQGEIKAQNAGRCVDSMVLQQTVKEVMSAPVLTVTPETALKDAVSLLSDHHISGLAVVDPNG